MGRILTNLTQVRQPACETASKTVAFPRKSHRSGLTPIVIAIQLNPLESYKARSTPSRKK